MLKLVKHFYGYGYKIVDSNKQQIFHSYSKKEADDIFEKIKNLKIDEINLLCLLDNMHYNILIHKLKL